MPVVSNTSPVLNLAIIGQLPLLHEQFGDVWIPRRVLEELRVEEDLPGNLAVREALAAGWLRVGEAKDQTLARVLQRDLDAGEAEAIVLALQMQAGRVLLDEREGRRIAKSLGLKVTGVLGPNQRNPGTLSKDFGAALALLVPALTGLGILLRARREGKLSSLRQTMDTLRQEAGFRIEPALYSDVLREGGENKEH